MPAYISHAIMGSEVYENSQNCGKVFKVLVDENEFRAYSLGADLSTLSKKNQKDPHNYYTQAFFLNMINYIKDNKLIDNGHVLALLYGHMSHYFFDINTHPLVYYNECGCEKVGMLSCHSLVEGYLDSYLSQKVLGKDIMEVKADYFSQVDLSVKEVAELLNNVYGKVYGDFRIIETYKKTFMIFKILENVIKSGLVSKKTLISFSRFNQFLEQNDLSINDLTNEDRQIYTNPVTGEVYNDSFMELYDKSIDMTIDALIKVNEYLYGNSTLASLENVFTDLSYDTGVSCSLGKKLVYVRGK